MQHLILTTAKLFFALCPFERGKQTAANFVYRRILSNVRGTTQFTHGSMKFLIDLHDRIQAIFYMTGLYEAKTLRAAVNSLAKVQVPIVLDVGANVGLLSLQVKDHYPSAHVHMFEADPTVYQQLIKNVSLNDLSDLKIHNLAVSANSGETLTFVKSQLSTESGWGRIQNEENKNHVTEKYQVRSISIDQYLTDHKINHVDLLKIDVEGAEALVLKGAARTLKAGTIRTIICEINPEALAAFSSSPDEVSELLAGFDYTFVGQVDMNSIFQRKH